MRYTIDHFKKLAQDKYGECLSDEYKNCRTKIEFKCSCGNCWFAEPRHIIDGRWCPKCGRQKGRKYNVNHNFFSEETEAAFYVAGFMAADGWKTNKTNGAYNIGFQLAAKDENQIKLIRSLMKCNSRIDFRKRKNTSGSISFSYGFVANSKQMYYDLDKFNITERKTYTYHMNDWMMQHYLIKHFMRGYIDGDGCFTEVLDDGNPRVHFSMRGTKIFLEQFHQILKINGVVSDDRVVIANAEKKEKVFGKLQYNGNGAISRLYHFLYDDAEYLLPRKKVIAAKSLEYAVYGDGEVKRKTRCTALPITKEIILEKAQELKSGQAIAKYFKCTPANISWWAKKLNIQEEYRKALGKLDYDLVFKRYCELKNYSTVAREFGVTKQRIAQVCKSYDPISM